MLQPLLVAFILGTVSIVAVRLLFPGLEGGVVAAILACLAIAGLWRRYYKTEELDRNRAGDNLYYLRLLFTLISLAYVLIALFIVGSGDRFDLRVHGLVGNFGIALTSTIFGILARIFLQSSQQSISLTDESSSEPQEDAADVVVLRRKVKEATDAMTHFTRMTLTQAEQTKSHTDLLLSDFTQHITKVSSQGREQAVLALDETKSEWLQLAIEFRRDSKDLLQALNKHIEETAETIKYEWTSVAKQMEIASGSAVKCTSEIAERIQPLLSRLSTLENSLKSFDGSLSNTTRRFNELTDSAEAYTVSTKEIRESILQHGVMTRQLAEQTSREADRAKTASEEASAIHSSIQQLLTRLEKINTVLGSFDQSLGEVTRELDSMTAAAEKYSVTAEKQQTVAELHAGGTRRLAEQSLREADDVRRARETLVEVIQDLANVVRKN